MKKLLCAVACVIALCALSLTACSGKEYDKLNRQYNEVLVERASLKKTLEWLELYNSVKTGKSFEEISALFAFGYATRDYVKQYSDDGGYCEMDAYTWHNRDAFDYLHVNENQIVVVFLDNVSIYKQYGDQMLVLDDGKVVFPSPKPN